MLVQREKYAGVTEQFNHFPQNCCGDSYVIYHYGSERRTASPVGWHLKSLRVMQKLRSHCDAQTQQLFLWFRYLFSFFNYNFLFIFYLVVLSFNIGQHKLFLKRKSIMDTYVEGSKNEMSEVM